MSWLVPLSKLDCKQRSAVELPTERLVIIAGERRSGKTVTLLQRAHRACEAGRQMPAAGVFSKNVQIWTASAEVRDLLRHEARLLDLDETCIARYDDWCENVYCETINSSLPVEPFTGEINNTAIRTIVRHAVEAGFARKPKFDLLFLDEAGQFDPLDVAFMSRMARHFTLNIATDAAWDNVALDVLLSALGCEKADVMLDSNRQRNPLIEELCSMLSGIPIPEMRAIDDSAKESLTYYHASDFSSEVAHLAEVLRERMYRNEDIGILVPNRQIRLAVRDALQSHGIQAQAHEETQSRCGPDFSNNRPKVLTFGAARGLTFDTIVLPCLDPRNFRGFEHDEVPLVLAEAAKRAAAWVYMSSAGPAPITGQQCIDLLGRQSPRIETAEQKSKSRRRAPSTTAIDDLL